ncbi:S8 family peptidase [Saccharopolyspora antimicrobica]|uniref:S8 family peptidase n=1 Tax=Saccharopolyspora antimicrobica TaxID=455193 RepID=UPI001FE75021|nr:S8 family serine peptidase [Saccharopolyspora antimicrobica]
MYAKRSLRTLLAAAVGSLGILLIDPSAAHAQQCVGAGQQSSPVPWAQRVLTPERLWPLTAGSKQRVAVVGSGVSSPLLEVKAGVDLSPPSRSQPSGKPDCIGLGTAVAGVIGAAETGEHGFHGVAPKTQLLSAKVVGDSYPSSGQPGQAVAPETLAAGINWSLDQGATVITVAAVSYQDSPALRQAVDRALAADAVVIAAAGTAGQNDPPGIAPYPASYDDVLSIGMIGEDGMTAAATHAPRIDLVAPGAEVTSAYPDGGVGPATGTELAAGYVAGTVALLRDYLPQLSNEDVKRRLLATASPAPEGVGSRNYGHGILNPYQAAVGNLAGGHPSALPPADPGVPSDEELAREAAWQQSTSIAYGLAGAGAAAAVAMTAVVVFGPRGRRRRWRAGIAEAPVERPEDDLPEPPAELFDDRPRTGA